MLQVNNLDDTKSEWNPNETHIVIPMLESDIMATKDADKSGNDTITINSMDGGDQTVFTSGLEHSVVIGLDRNLFETHNNKSDLLVIQNSDLKLLPCTAETKNTVAYTLSFVDQDKSEIIWESSLLKEKNKSDWCLSDKTIFEMKDVLTYDDSVQDPSRTWSDDLEKNEQINLVADLTSQTCKTQGNLLVPVEDTVNDVKKSVNEVGNSHFIVNYFPALQCNESVSLLPSMITVPVKHVMSGKSVIKNEDDIHDDLLFKKITESSQSSELGPGNSNNLVTVNNDRCKGSIVCLNEEEINEPKNVESNQCTIIIEDMEKNVETRINKKKDSTQSESVVNEVKTLSEKSLPLKKKAKMKRTDISPRQENFKNLNKLEAAYTNEDAEQINYGYDNNCQSTIANANNVVLNEIDKEIIKNSGMDVNQIMKNKFSSGNLVNRNNHIKHISRRLRLEKSIFGNNSITNRRANNANLSDFHNQESSSIFDLLQDLKSTKMISTSVWQTLYNGLKEMDVDILQEMRTKQGEGEHVESVSYSAHLKAFALMLHFKQPTAFNYLAKKYEKGWPSLSVIKDWKRKVNNHQKPNKWHKKSWSTT